MIRKTQILSSILKTGLLLALLFTSRSGFAQDNKTPAEQTAIKTESPAYNEATESYDPLGRPYQPIIGWLAPEIEQTVPAAVGNFLSISFENGVRGDAYTPYGLVPKTKLEIVSKAATYLSKKALKNEYFQQAVGVQYLLQLEVLHYNQNYSFDTIPATDRNGPTFKKVFSCYANLTARLTDVATSKIVLVNNFDVQADSRDARPKPGQTDSVVTLQKMYAATKDQGRQMFAEFVAGVGKITQIKEGSDEKAESVLVNNNKLMMTSIIGQTFDVYAIQEEFTDNEQIFTHLEKVGMLMKKKDFNYKERNFEVEKGGKNIAPLLKAGKTLVCVKYVFPMRPLLPGGRRPSIIFEPFTSTLKFPSYRLRILEDATKEYFSRFPQLLDVVDRETYQLIENERQLQSKTHSAATQAGVSIGAEYVLKAEITQYRFSREVFKKEKPQAAAPPPAPTPPAKDAKPTTDQKDKKVAGDNKDKKPPAVEKPVIRFVEMVPAGIRATAFIRADIRLVSIKTGEIFWNSNFDAQASRDYPLDQSVAMQKRQEEEVLHDLANNFSLNAGPQLFKRLNGRSPVLQISESKEAEAKRVLIGGGSYAGILPGMRFDVIEVTEETIDGQLLEREAPIGELKIAEIFPETTMCKVTEGGAPILAAFGAKSRLYCKPK